MFKVYWKQAIGMLKENRLLSGISVIGTALAISMIMVMVITFQLRVGNYPPEVHRDRMLYVRWGGRLVDGKPYGNGYLSLKTMKECLLPLETPELVSIVSPWRTQLASLPGGKEKKDCLILYTDDVFWKIFEFCFIAGKPYGKEDAVASGIKKAVVSESVARRLYGSSEVTGKSLMLGYQPYTICGVVKDVSSVAKASYAEIWIPYSAELFQDDVWAESITGWYQGIVLARSSADFEAIREEIGRAHV